VKGRKGSPEKASSKRERKGRKRKLDNLLLGHCTAPSKGRGSKGKKTARSNPLFYKKKEEKDPKKLNMH